MKVKAPPKGSVEARLPDNPIMSGEKVTLDDEEMVQKDGRIYGGLFDCLNLTHIIVLVTE